MKDDKDDEMQGLVVILCVLLFYVMLYSLNALNLS